MFIYNSMATINADSGNDDKALSIFEKIISVYKNEPKTLDYLRILFNFANSLTPPYINCMIITCINGNVNSGFILTKRL